MPRTKSPAMRREPSEIHSQSNGIVHRDGYSEKAERIPAMLDQKLASNGKAGAPGETVAKATGNDPPGILNLIISVGGIYGAFLSWAWLQERITTTAYGPNNDKWRYPVFLNTVQSVFAALSGLVYLFARTSHPHKPGRPAPIFPTSKILPPLLLISITSSLASPFGYSSLQHIDYVTFILAKSCKLLPVMFLHVTLFRKRFPVHKYMVVALVTLGVSLFTLHQGSSKKHSSKSSGNKNQAWGLFLLAVNLLFDGLTNSVQDNIFSTFRPYSGPQMMCAQNIMSTLLTASYLLLAPYIAPTFFGSYIGMSPGSELSSALTFIKTYPAVGWDVVGFAVCGAIGQVFIFHTLSTFSSLLLVTVTVTRKMLTMVLSVLWFGHKIKGMQWLGVALVFGGIGAEAVLNRREKNAKAKAAKAKLLSDAGQDRKIAAEREGKKEL
ncbi:hypothetical protein FKW77_002412 [Venturia effusa]|uniref:UDP-galactose transporter homolog 1 n=1 Tax=Venturia effusa TaxID=50376 RepID=A0A517LDD3_9PEZI|nr:hypothetical protein FKW77_002412 [Venturia effusa]